MELKINLTNAEERVMAQRILDMWDSEEEVFESIHPAEVTDDDDLEYAQPEEEPVVEEPVRPKAAVPKAKKPEPEEPEIQSDEVSLKARELFKKGLISRDTVKEYLKECGGEAISELDSVGLAAFNEKLENIGDADVSF